jgi:hypothetical protein
VRLRVPLARLVSAVAIAAAALVSVHTPAAAASSSPLDWATPVLADPPVGGVHSSLNGVSCPSEPLCVAVDRFGGITTSTDPEGGVWQPVSVLPGVALYGVSCPSISLCVAVGHNSSGSDILTSTNPTGGAVAWTNIPIASRGLYAVDCRSKTFCVAGGAHGPGQPDLLTSTDPTGGASAWQGVMLTEHPLISSLSCPSRRLCVGVGVYGHGSIFGSHTTIATSTRPTAGADAWRVKKYYGYDEGPTGLSCPTTKLCVAVGDTPRILISTDPAGPLKSWKTARPHGGLPGHSFLTGVSCPASSLCVASSYYDFVGSATKPTHRRRGWRTDSIPGLTHGDRGFWNGVSCPSPATCVLVDRGGYATVGTAG